jgi:hypothetical protein
MTTNVSEIVSIPAHLAEEYFDFEMQRQSMIVQTCRDIDQLYRQYQAILYQLQISNKALEKVADYSIDDECEIPILKRKELRIQIPVILSTLDILYEQKSIVLIKLEERLMELNQHRQACLEHAKMNVTIAHELDKAGIQNTKNLIAYC